MSAIVPYTAELYPTQARATGVGYANGAGRIASIISPAVVGFAVQWGLAGVFMSLAGGFLLTAAAVLLLGTETGRLHLDEASLEVSASSGSSKGRRNPAS